MLIIDTILYVIGSLQKEEDPNKNYRKIQTERGKKIKLAGIIIGSIGFGLNIIFQSIELYWYKKGKIIGE